MKLAYRNNTNAEAISRIFNKSLDKPEWYQVKAASNGGESEILIYDYIGWPYNDPSDLIREMADMGDILGRINSPGGDVWDGMAIYNAFATHKGGTVTMRIEGIAASMASVIAMAGKKVHAYDNTMLMIHNAWSYTAGNQYELSDMADLLGKVDENMVDIYQGKSKIGKRELSQMMKDTTFMNAKEAKKKGFVDVIIDGKTAKADFDLSIYGNAPEGYGQGESTIRDQEQALRDVGFSQKEAKAILSGRKDGTQRDVEGIQAEVDRITNIMKS